MLSENERSLEMSKIETGQTPFNYTILSQLSIISKAKVQRRKEKCYWSLESCNERKKKLIAKVSLLQDFKLRH